MEISKGFIKYKRNYGNLNSIKVQVINGDSAHKHLDFSREICQLV